MKIVPNDDNVKGMPRPYKTGMPMTDFSMPRWLVWARELQALSQTGLTFSDNPFDTQRYGRLAEIAAEMVESQAGLPATETLANFQVQPGYATPKVDVRGAVIRDGRILLVQERVDGCWSMPGGWADVGRPAFGYGGARGVGGERLPGGSGQACGRVRRERNPVSRYPSTTPTS